MAVREVLQLGDPVLREVALPVADPGAPEIAGLIDDLRDTLAHWKATTGYGRGIAAPQIGVLKRVVFLNVDGQTPWPMINPELVIKSDEMMTVWDGCLSFLTIFFETQRHCTVTIRYQDQSGDWHEHAADCGLSELLQHEVDHLDGILALDRLTDTRTIVSRHEFEKRFLANSPYARRH